MGESVKIMSLNCQGLSGREKRKDVLNFLKGKKYSIYCLQDTHFTKQEEKLIRSIWGYECIFNSFSSNSRGVAIFLNNNFEYKIHNISRSNDGNKLVLDIFMMEKRVTLINTYCPNRDTPDFFSEVSKDIDVINIESIIWVGDFNLVLDQKMDTGEIWFGFWTEY